MILKIIVIDQHLHVLNHAIKTCQRISEERTPYITNTVSHDWESVNDVNAVVFAGNDKLSNDTDVYGNQSYCIESCVTETIKEEFRKYFENKEFNNDNENNNNNNNSDKSTEIKVILIFVDKLNIIDNRLQKI